MGKFWGVCICLGMEGPIRVGTTTSYSGSTSYGLVALVGLTMRI